MAGLQISKRNTPGPSTNTPHLVVPPLETTQAVTIPTVKAAPVTVSRSPFHPRRPRSSSPDTPPQSPVRIEVEVDVHVGAASGNGRTAGYRTVVAPVPQPDMMVVTDADDIDMIDETPVQITPEKRSRSPTSAVHPKRPPPPLRSYEGNNVLYFGCNRIKIFNISDEIVSADVVVPDVDIDDQRDADNLWNDIWAVDEPAPFIEPRELATPPPDTNIIIPPGS